MANVLFLPGSAPSVVLSTVSTPAVFLAPSTSAVLVSSVSSVIAVPKVYVETPAGTKNGSNVTFTLSRLPVNILGFYINGIYQIGGTAVSMTVTLPLAPISTDSLDIIYDSLS